MPLAQLAGFTAGAAISSAPEGKHGRNLASLPAKVKGREV
jgi:hypothetical protein